MKSTNPPFQFVVAYEHKKYVNGRFECERRVQLLMERTYDKFLWWEYSVDEVLDFEIVPNYVWIAIATLGYDSSNWKSKFFKNPNVRQWTWPGGKFCVPSNWMDKIDAQIF